MEEEMRYTPLRKMEILNDIVHGRVPRESAMRLHNLSEDELREWERGYKSGVKALRVTNIKERNNG
jgi:hypothetical protein